MKSSRFPLLLALGLALAVFGPHTITLCGCSQDSDSESQDDTNSDDSTLTPRDQFVRRVCKILQSCCDNNNYERDVKRCEEWWTSGNLHGVGFNEKHADACLELIQKDTDGPMGCGEYAWTESRECKLAMPKIPEQDKSLGGAGLGESCEFFFSCHHYDDALGGCVDFGTKGESDTRCVKLLLGSVGNGPCVDSKEDDPLPVPDNYEMYSCDPQTSRCNKDTRKCEAITLVDVGEECNSIDKKCKPGTQCAGSPSKCEPLAANGEACRYNSDCLSYTCKNKVCLYYDPSFGTRTCGDKKK